MAWVKYDISTSWAGGLSNKAKNVQDDNRCNGLQRNTSDKKNELNIMVCR